MTSNTFWLAFEPIFEIGRHAAYVEFSLLKTVEYTQHHICVVGPRTFSPSASMSILNYLIVVLQSIRIILFYIILEHEFRAKAKCSPTACP